MTLQKNAVPESGAGAGADPVRRRHWLAAIGLLPLLQACSPLRLINAVVPDATYTLVEGLAYGDATRQRMDVYLPKPAVAGAPMAVFFYGGSWNSGDRADYKFVGEALASQGIVTVVADYRLSPEVRYPVFLEDSAQAVKVALDNADAWGVSRERLFLMGHSAGAYNAAMLALDPRWLGGAGVAREQFAGWIGLAGPYDFLPIKVPEVKQAFNWPETPADSQPLFYAKQPDPAAPARVLLIAAREDKLVDPQRNTVGLGQALVNRGEDVQVTLLDGVGHATLIGAMARPLRGLAPVLAQVRQFVAKRPS
jgi:acetyl esterase/lipase